MKRTTTLLLALALAACKTPPAPTAPPDIGALRAQHHYVSALRLLDVQPIDSGSPAAVAARNAQRDELLSELRAYQAQLLQEVDDKAHQKHFTEARAQLEAALPELPVSTELQEFTQQFYANRDRYLQRSLDELYALRGAQIAREQPVYQALQNAGGDSDVCALVARHQDDMNYFAQQLARAGALAFSQKDYPRAIQYLGVANQLTPTPALAAQVARAESTMNNARQKTQAVRSAEREQRYRELSVSIQLALDQRDYAGARQQLDEARTLAIHNDEMDLFQHQLDDAIGVFVTQQVEEGNRRYVNGHIEEALQMWRQADALSPSQDLKERIEKAQRFMDRYQQLQKPAGG